MRISQRVTLPLWRYNPKRIKQEGRRIYLEKFRYFNNHRQMGNKDRENQERLNRRVAKGVCMPNATEMNKKDETTGFCLLGYLKMTLLGKSNFSRIVGTIQC